MPTPEELLAQQAREGAPANDAPSEVLLRTTRERLRAFDLALALQAEGVRHRLEASTDGDEWRVWVRADEEQQGRAALSAFEAENQPRLAHETPAMATGSVGLLFVVLCVVGQLATGARDPQVVWFAKGSADASRILAGEWWRCVTALTLHADLAHALGNAASGWLLLEAVARRIGPGRTAVLALLAGAGGNALTALVMHGHFDSIGASTAVFGVLGAATMLQAFLRVRRGWLVVGAGLALLGTLGTGEHADLFGHLFGFAVGAALGVLMLPFARKPKRLLAVEVALGAVVLAALGGAWAQALRGG